MHQPINSPSEDTSQLNSPILYLFKPTIFSVAFTLLATTTLPFIILTLLSLNPYAFSDLGIIGGFSFITYFAGLIIYEFIVYNSIYAILAIFLLFFITYAFASFLQKQLSSNILKGVIIVLFFTYAISVLAFVGFPVAQKHTKAKAEIQAEKSELETNAGKKAEELFFGVGDEPNQNFGSNQYLNGMAYRFDSTKNYGQGVTSISSISIVEQPTAAEALTALNNTTELRCSAKAMEDGYLCNMTKINDNWILIVTTKYTMAYHWVSDDYTFEYMPSHETYLEKYLQKYPSTLRSDYKPPVNSL